jgi:peptidoglycan/xylan/chitin deacetylase (PgdA/CDA1 family)
MICLTLDIHHASLGLPYNPYSDISELRVTQLVLKMLEKHGVKATVFVTGKCFTEEWDELRPICKHPLVEIGGHNYFCFKPEFFHEFWQKVFNNPNGPWPFQLFDVKKTIDIILEKTGYRIVSWRNHTLAHGPNTERVLSLFGLRICADEVRASGAGPERHETGIYNFPINTMPDYDHVYHAHRSEERVKASSARYGWSDDFGSDSYHVDQWTNIVLEQIRKKLEINAAANVLVHPMTQYIADKMASFERLIAYIGCQPNCFYRELPLIP